LIDRIDASSELGKFKARLLASPQAARIRVDAAEALVGRGKNKLGKKKLKQGGRTLLGFVQRLNSLTGRKSSIPAATRAGFVSAASPIQAVLKRLAGSL
jgi:hypothetical protein